MRPFPLVCLSAIDVTAYRYMSFFRQQCQAYWTSPAIYGKPINLISSSIVGAHGIQKAS